MVGTESVLAFACCLIADVLTVCADGGVELLASDCVWVSVGNSDNRLDERSSEAAFNLGPTTGCGSSERRKDALVGTPPRSTTATVKSVASASPAMTDMKHRIRKLEEEGATEPESCRERDGEGEGDAAGPDDVEVDERGDNGERACAGEPDTDAGRRDGECVGERYEGGCVAMASQDGS